VEKNVRFINFYSKAILILRFMVPKVACLFTNWEQAPFLFLLIDEYEGKKKQPKKQVCITN